MTNSFLQAHEEKYRQQKHNIYITSFEHEDNMLLKEMLKERKTEDVHKNMSLGWGARGTRWQFYPGVRGPEGTRWQFNSAGGAGWTRLKF